MFARARTSPNSPLKTRIVLLLSLSLAACLSANADFQSRLDAYVEGCIKLRDEATTSGHVSYQQVMTAVYGGESQQQAYLQATIKWQSDYEESNTFYANYQNVGLNTQFSEVLPVRNSKLGSTLIGRYEPRADAIKLASIANGFAVAHESGHALQRDALLHRRAWHAERKQFDPLHNLIHEVSSNRANTPQAAGRLRYLSSQDELEIRLQDLNRLYAIHSGNGPIQTPLQALQALVYVGIPLSEESVSEALRGTSWEQSASSLQTLLEKTSPTTPADPNLENSFEDAYELARLYHLIQGLEPRLWNPTLKKLLFEAPGHL